jgi:imidazole glycerol-phosphate synthase subunit HisH
MIAVIDMKLGNVHSVCNALRFLHIEYALTSDPDRIKEANKLIFPGVGTFSEVSNRLIRSGVRDCIREEVLHNKKPILGICLGMQLLAESGEEGGYSQGLGLIKANVKKLPCNASMYRLPHIGWNDVKNKGMRIFNGIEDDSCFYFVHSYAMDLNEKCSVALCNYGVDFIAAVEKEHIVGTQFHPEKSREKGLRILKNFVENF